MENDNFKVPDINLKPTTKPIPQFPVGNSEDNDNEKPPPSKPITPKIECPYIVPPWSQTADESVSYNFEVLKNGVIVETVNNLQKKPYWVFGRLDSCHIVMAHPTISRFHAVLQYRVNENEGNLDEKADNSIEQDGWYLYDMNSTHGTFLNKMRIKPNIYVPIRVGHMIQLGASTRKYILQGPEYDEEEESELTVTQLKEQKVKKQQQLREQIEEEKRAKELAEKQREEEGISWGMGEDADEESDLAINPYASTNNEELFLDDPKKTLRGFFEREGFELDYKVDELSAGSYVVKIELPIDDANGYPLVAEVSHKGKKKDAVFQGALEACRLLDRQGVLRRATHEPRRKKQNDSESDEDEFLDRTGDVERKRQKKLASMKTNALSYDELIQEETELLTKLTEIHNKIDKYQEEQRKLKALATENDADDLDNFMSSLEQDKKIGKTEIKRLRLEEKRLKEDHVRLRKIIKIAAPVNLPPLIKQTDLTSETGDETSKSVPKKVNLPLFGKRPKFEKSFGMPSKTKTAVPSTELQSSNYKSDEEEDDEQEKTTELEEGQSNIIRGPQLDPKLIKQISSPEMDLADDATGQSQAPEENQMVASKKRKNRQRNRGKNRDNVDFDDSIEMGSEKYSGWIPPENQAGDGYTTLNKKFGY